MSTTLNLHVGMSLADALSAARSLGCAVVPVRRTGEVRVSHASLSKVVTVNNRRKDASRILVTTLRSLLKTHQPDTKQPQDDGHTAPPTFCQRCGGECRLLSPAPLPCSTPPPVVHPVAAAPSSEDAELRKGLISLMSFELEPGQGPEDEEQPATVATEETKPMSDTPRRSAASRADTFTQASKATIEKAARRMMPKRIYFGPKKRGLCSDYSALLSYVQDVDLAIGLHDGLTYAELDKLVPRPAGLSFSQFRSMLRSLPGLKRYRRGWQGPLTLTYGALPYSHRTGRAMLPASGYKYGFRKRSGVPRPDFRHRPLPLEQAEVPPTYDSRRRRSQPLVSISERPDRVAQETVTSQVHFLRFVDDQVAAWTKLAKAIGGDATR